jgi:uncharacterized surface protein with fasciclin (FAS1) repeats
LPRIGVAEPLGAERFVRQIDFRYSEDLPRIGVAEPLGAERFVRQIDFRSSEDLPRIGVAEPSARRYLFNYSQAQRILFSSEPNPISRLIPYSLQKFQITVRRKRRVQKMKRLYAILFVIAGIALASSSASAQMMKENAMMKENPMVGVAAMYPTKTIVANAMNSADHTTLVAAVKAAGLVDTLNSAGPFTVFAPTNAAFEQLPAGTVDMLLKAENKATLTRVLTYHVVSGKYDSKVLGKLIKKGHGKAWLKTVSGGTLTAMMDGNNIVLRDEKGGTSTVTTADVYQSNGVIHVVNAVLLPN